MRSKIAKYISANFIFDHLLANNILHPEQHGFFRDRIRSNAVAGKSASKPVSDIGPYTNTINVNV